MSYDAPFAGLKVVDLEPGGGGPYCGCCWPSTAPMSSRSSPPARATGARTLGRRYGGHTAYSIPTNLGKRSIALDLKSGEGKDVLWRLIDGADVLLEGFRPGVLDRLGFGYAAVAKREPRILYLSVSGFGQTGPLAGRPAMDPVLQAFTGLMMDNKGEDGIPHRVPFVVIDMSTALYAFQALSAALYARRDQPHGRHIAVSLLEAASAMQVIRMMMVYLEGEQVRRSMPSGVFKTADGWLQFLIVRQQQLGELCAGCWRCRELAADPRFIDEDGAHAQRGGADGHRAAGDRGEADGLPGPSALQQGRHHARAAEQLPRVPGPAAGRGDRPRSAGSSLAAAPEPVPVPNIAGIAQLRGWHAARHHAGARPAHRRHPARASASAQRKSQLWWNARSCSAVGWVEQDWSAPGG